MFPRLESRHDLLRMLDELADTRKGILRRCAMLRPDQLADPVWAGTWSVLQNLAHLAWAEEWMLAWIHARPGTLSPNEYPIEPPLELDAVRIALDEAHAAAIAFLKSRPESVLSDKCQFGWTGEQTVGGVFFHLVEHEIHHRAFLLRKLDQLTGADRPSPPAAPA